MILAIETSDVLCSVAFWDEGKILAEYNHELPMQHATLVGYLVNNGLEFLGGKLRARKYLIDDISAVAVGIGPGSFTGLRIGLSYAQGFCFGNEIPIVGVSNHQVLAVQRIPSIRRVFTIIEARREEVYLAEHAFLEDKYPEIKTHQIVKKANLNAVIPTGSQVICNRTLKLDQAIIDQAEKRKIELISHGSYSASILAEIGLHKFGLKGSDSLTELEPMYIRPFAGVK
ncbi:MAG: tRNA (adenosine(37)-N6)-threonylcarbamoyltransferase complex dimerization subunit type 1 TsaB [Calditrichaceae bacterium]